MSKTFIIDNEKREFSTEFIIKVTHQYRLLFFCHIGNSFTFSLLFSVFTFSPFSISFNFQMRCFFFLFILSSSWNCGRAVCATKVSVKMNEDHECSKYLSGESGRLSTSTSLFASLLLFCMFCLAMVFMFAFVLF